MSDPAAAEFLDPDVRFVEHPPPRLTPWERGEVDRLWAETRALNPAAFDGPVVVGLGVDRTGAGTVVRWARMTYRSRALRRLWPAERVPGSVYVTALVPTENGLVVGRGSAATAAPGRWTLPGGAVEPPPAGELLDLAGVRRHAARELAEETGLLVSDDRLRLWALTRSRRFGGLGFHFLCPHVSAALVRRLHAGQADVPPYPGAGGPELDEISFVSSPAVADALGPTTDYLPQVCDRYFTD
ncbi:NUDIX domain-containing protein [Streptomyces sp. CC208A]|uniref:NUDIX hydrolase n=1 Tax=Streptomyces sp. CC208A TaxID=3044573 RepID=UPI0024A9A242|nr:NUDIX domain-containing protein [Streptomyces sp. CC208A]